VVERKTARTVGSGHAVGGRSMVEVREGTGLGGTVTGAVNVASFSAGVRPLRAMEKRS
jgi:hypothetical protein